jgi:hypothetical protein
MITRPWRVSAPANSMAGARRCAWPDDRASVRGGCDNPFERRNVEILADDDATPSSKHHLDGAIALRADISRHVGRGQRNRNEPRRGRSHRRRGRVPIAERLAPAKDQSRRNTMLARNPRHRIRHRLRDDRQLLLEQEQATGVSNKNALLVSRSRHRYGHSSYRGQPPLKNWTPSPSTLAAQGGPPRMRTALLSLMQILQRHQPLESGRSGKAMERRFVATNSHKSLRVCPETSCGVA